MDLNIPRKTTAVDRHLSSNQHRKITKKYRYIQIKKKHPIYL